MRVGLFLAGPREAKTFFGPTPPLVAPLPLPTDDEPLPAGRPRVLEVPVPNETLITGGLGEPLTVLASCLDIVVSVDSLRDCTCRRSATSANGTSEDDEDGGLMVLDFWIAFRSASHCLKLILTSEDFSEEGLFCLPDSFVL